MYVAVVVYCADNGIIVRAFSMIYANNNISANQSKLTRARAGDESSSRVCVLYYTIIYLICILKTRL